MHALATIARSILVAIAAIIAAIARLFGFGSQPPIPAPTLTTPTPESIPGSSAGTEDTHSPGALVHAYAAAGQAERATMDLASLTTDQMCWLLALAEADLRRLAHAGPQACERAVQGKRSGVVGLARPGDRQDAEPDAGKSHRGYERLADRIRRRHLEAA